MPKGEMVGEDLQIVEEREMKGKEKKEKESVHNVSKGKLLRGPQCVWSRYSAFLGRL